MSDVRVITNNVPRDTIAGEELTPEERDGFDYLDFAAIERGEDSATFFRYRGELYDLGEFSTTWGISRDGGMPDFLKGWDGYISDSFFSGIVVRYGIGEWHDQVVVGRFFT